MKQFKKMTAFAVLLATLGVTPQIDAQEGVASIGGIGYEESMVLPSMTPYIAICTVAAIGIVAIAVRHSHGHGHSHNHNH